MIFKNKQKAKQPSSDESPRAPRYSCVAKVSINGFEGEAVLRNINHGGFRMESRTYAAIMVGEHYTMWIKPEVSANLPSFNLEVEVRWVRSTETSFNSGFLVIKPPADRSFEKYIEHNKVQQSAFQAASAKTP
jgi:hypothetical protein